MDGGKSGEDEIGSWGKESVAGVGKIRLTLFQCDVGPSATPDQPE